jgi:hypothetical protein
MGWLARMVGNALGRRLLPGNALITVVIDLNS